jgi:hypothetical protein
MILRDSFAERSLRSNSYRDELLKELSLIEEALKPIQGALENCKETANMTSTRVAFGFFATIGMQFALS